MLREGCVLLSCHLHTDTALAVGTRRDNSTCRQQAGRTRPFIFRAPLPSAVGVMGKSTPPPSRCWFSKLSTEQCVELAASVGMTGCDLVTRLHEHPLAAKYGMTWTNEGCGGLSMDALKTMCATRGLAASGTRFLRVLALLKHEVATKAVGARGAKKKAQAKAQAATPKTATPVDKNKRRRLA